MKNNHLPLSDLLQTFNLVTTKGNKVGEHYEFEGIKAWHDFDGYTCFIGYKELTLTLLFHGRYFFDFQQQETLDSFLSKVKQLLASK